MLEHNNYVEQTSLHFNTIQRYDMIQLILIVLLDLIIGAIE